MTETTTEEAPAAVQPMPVPGYTEQFQTNLDLVSSLKLIEEVCMRAIDNLASMPETDKHFVEIGRDGINMAFMALCRSVFRPKRIALPMDDQNVRS